MSFLFKILEFFEIFFKKPLNNKIWRSVHSIYLKNAFKSKSQFQQNLKKISNKKETNSKQEKTRSHQYSIRASNSNSKKCARKKYFNLISLNLNKVSFHSSAITFFLSFQSTSKRKKNSKRKMRSWSWIERNDFASHSIIFFMWIFFSFLLLSLKNKVCWLNDSEETTIHLGVHTLHWLLSK